MASSGAVTAGSAAPAATLHFDDGASLPLASFAGRQLVLYFYPRDDTPGCTTQGRDFTALIDRFRETGTEIVGVSPDTMQSHQRFREKHALAIKLVSDQDQAIAKAFGTWVEKSMYGKTFMGVERSTFLIDPTGRVVRVWRKVKVKTLVSG